MKNKLILVFGILLVSGLIFVGCKTDDETSDNEVDVTGTWIAFSGNAEENDCQWEFNFDSKGNYVLKIRGEAEAWKGTYVFTEDEFLQTITHEWKEDQWVEVENKTNTSKYVFHDNNTLEIFDLNGEKIDQVVGVYKRLN